MEEQNFKELAAMFNDHQVTDGDGQIMEEGNTSVEDTATQELETTEEDTATAEKSEGSDQKVTQTQETETESELAEDESGKRYVPEKRLKEVYGKWKRTERELEEIRAQRTASTQPAQPATTTTQVTAPKDRTEALEIDMLHSTLPQFNPDSEDYSPALDSLGAQFLRANPGITRIQAAKMAIQTARDIAQKEVHIATEARKVKALQSDPGITSRVVSRSDSKASDPEKMTLQEKEEWLKSNGMW